MENSSLVSDLTDLTPLLAVVSHWRIYLGVPKVDSSEELAVNSNFIYENFGHLTVNEIKLAYTLSITGKTDDVEFFGSFSPLYISKVLKSYMVYRKKILEDTLRRKDKAYDLQLEENKRPSPQEQADLTKEIFRDFYRDWQNTGEINDVFNICYYFLRPKDESKKKYFSPTKEEVEIALKWGKEKAELLSKSSNQFIKNKATKEECDKWARNWCVQNFFKDIDINIFLNNIKSEFFI